MVDQKLFITLINYYFQSRNSYLDILLSIHVYHYFRNYTLKDTNLKFGYTSGRLVDKKFFINTK